MMRWASAWRRSWPLDCCTGPGSGRGGREGPRLGRRGEGGGGGGGGSGAHVDQPRDVSLDRDMSLVCGWGLVPNGGLPPVVEQGQG